MFSVVVLFHIFVGLGNKNGLVNTSKKRCTAPEKLFRLTDSLGLGRREVRFDHSVNRSSDKRTLLVNIYKRVSFIRMVKPTCTKKPIVNFLFVFFTRLFFSRDRESELCLVS